MIISNTVRPVFVHPPQINYTRIRIIAELIAIYGTGQEFWAEYAKILNCIETGAEYVIATPDAPNHIS